MTPVLATSFRKLLQGNEIVSVEPQIGVAFNYVRPYLYLVQRRWNWSWIFHRRRFRFRFFFIHNFRL